MNLDKSVIKFCIEDAEAKFQKQIEQARSLYQKAWEAAQDDHDRCFAPVRLSYPNCDKKINEMK